MTDETLDRLVRDADPYDPEAVRNLRGADQVLMEEIMSTAGATSITSRRRRRVAALGLVAATTLAVAVSVPAILKDGGTGPDDSGRTVQVGGGTDRIAYSAAAVEVAKNNPRLLIDEPGWKATTVYGFAKDSGTINFTKGDRQVEMNWYPADSYQGYFDDRTEVSKRTAITIDGQSGSRVTYAANDIAAMLEPEGPTFVEIRTAGGFTGTADVLQLFGKIKHVSVAAWLEALPPEIVTPSKIAKVADEILADVPRPPVLDVSKLESLGVNSRYHVGVELIDRVECGWIAEWERADRGGDLAAERRAVTALKSAHGWKILTEMDATGDYSEIPWQVADQAQVGADPRKFDEMLNCDEQR